mmetsp:Transcript_60590/g.192336  ORF Transcript_60590/g.192336 Transcript_60590/m.192336 type:complete len:150 (+) Transcript_60590:61-510(+)
MMRGPSSRRERYCSLACFPIVPTWTGMALGIAGPAGPGIAACASLACGWCQLCGCARGLEWGGILDWSNPVDFEVVGGRLSISHSLGWCKAPRVESFASEDILHLDVYGLAVDYNFYRVEGRGENRGLHCGGLAPDFMGGELKVLNPKP